jgi:diguanylate cyclase (GGDEF)-like protein
MSQSVTIPSYRLLLIRPQRIGGDIWDATIQTLMQVSDNQIVLVGVVDPFPSPDILIVAEMEGFPIVPDIKSFSGSFSHIVVEETIPDIFDPSGHPYPRIPFGVVSFMAEQIAARHHLIAIFNRYRAFAQSLTNLIPIDGSFRYEELICRSLRHLLSAEGVAYCEAKLSSRKVSLNISDPEGIFGKELSFPLTESVKKILFSKDRYFDDLDPEKSGITHLPKVHAGKFIIFKLEKGTAPKIPFLLIVPPSTSQDNPLPEIELQNALELSAPVLETSHALFKHSMYLKRKSEHDPLTKILNRDSLNAFLDFSWRNAKDHKAPLSALMLDIDHFKKINDSFGHQMGDMILLEVTQTISQTLRSNDGFGRYGGEEFVVLLPGLDKNKALMVAERIRLAVKNRSYPVDKPITISIGVASFPDDVSRETDLIPLADRMMYEAKRAGRNRVSSLNPKK